MAARMSARTLAPRDRIFCPNCERAYQIGAESLGPGGRRVRCPSCRAVWFECAAPSEPNGSGSNPILSPDFPRKLTLYLNGLPDQVKRNGTKLTHAIKSFLMREGLGAGAVGHANGIKIDLHHFRNTEFLWDAVAKVRSPQHPDEDIDLTFVAESENQVQIERILEDANKLPIVRADARLMFFRANDRKSLDYAFDRLRGLFERHRKTELGDIYILAGMDVQAAAYLVRKLTIRRELSNVSPWEEF
jgi:predicted Zn finger-like uncharacterized protein